MAMTSAQIAQLAQQQAVQQMGGNQAVAVQAATAAITAQQQMIVDSFRGQIYISDQLDVQDTPLYDTITLNAGQTLSNTTQWWTNVAANSGKGIAQTNMTENSQMAAPEAMAVFACKVGWSEGMLRSDLQTMVDGCAYRLIMGKKPYQEANLRHFSSGWGITGFTTRTAESAYTNGFPSWASMNTLAVKLVIANEMSFKAFLDGFSGGGQVLSLAGAGLIMINEFAGLYARGVQ